MSIVAANPAGFAAAEARLALGEPVVIPTPSPLAYVLFSDVPRAVNEVKGRPGDQSVGVTPTSLAPVRPFLAVDDRVAGLVGWLAFTEFVSVLVPVVDAVPPWLAPGVVDGMLAMAGAWLPALGPLLASRTYAYSSSANLTSGRPATNALQADAVFDGRLVVIDGDPYRRANVDHGSSTMISVAPDGAFAVHRHGIGDAAYNGDEDQYLADLHARAAAL